MVHCETTTGILNPLAPLSEIGKRKNVSLIIDAMSSFGAPKLLIASIIKDTFLRFPISDKGAKGFKIPVVVSQCTMATCVIDGSRVF